MSAYELDLSAGIVGNSPPPAKRKPAPRAEADRYPEPKIISTAEDDAATQAAAEAEVERTRTIMEKAGNDLNAASTPRIDLQAGVAKPVAEAVSHPVNQELLDTTATRPREAIPDAPPQVMTDRNREAITRPRTVAAVEPSYETTLSPAEETDFQQWKAQHAPKDSGADYDLRGAYKAGLKPDPQSGHWPDTFKKPNHPTFSNESQYATGSNAARAGHWEGDTYVPASTTSDADLHGEMAAPADAARVAAEQQRPSAIDTWSNAALSNQQNQEAQARQVAQERIRREQLLNQARKVMAQSGVKDAEKATPADVVKWAREQRKVADTTKESMVNGISTVDAGNAVPVAMAGQGFEKAVRPPAINSKTAPFDFQGSGPEALGRRTPPMGDLVDLRPSNRHYSATERNPNIHTITPDEMMKSLHQIAGEDEVLSGQNDVRSAPFAISVIGQQWPRLVGQVQSALANVVQYPERLTVSGRLVSMLPIYKRPEEEWHKLSAGVADYLRQRSDINTQIGNYVPGEESHSFPKSLARGLTNMGYDAGKIIALTEVTGIPFEYVMAGEAAIQNADKDLATQSKEIAKAYLFASVLKFGPRGITKFAEKALPRTISKLMTAHPIATEATIGAAGFGGLSGVEAHLAGGTPQQVAGATAGGAIFGALTAGGGPGELARRFKELPSKVIASDAVPEPIREVVGKVTGRKPVVIQSDVPEGQEPRFASVYVHPETGEYISREITTDEASKLLSKDRPARIVSESDFEKLHPPNFAEAAPAKPATAPINKQLTEKGTERTAKTKLEPKPAKPAEPSTRVEKTKEKPQRPEWMPLEFIYDSDKFTVKDRGDGIALITRPDGTLLAFNEAEMRKAQASPKYTTIPPPSPAIQSNAPGTERRKGPERTAENDVTTARSALEKIGGSLDARPKGAAGKWVVAWPDGTKELMWKDEDLIAKVRDRVNQSVQIPDKGAKSDADVKGTKPSDNLAEHPGVSPGTNVPANQSEPRQGDGGQTGSGSVAGDSQTKPGPAPKPESNAGVRGEPESEVKVSPNLVGLIRDHLTRNGVHPSAAAGMSRTLDRAIESRDPKLLIDSLHQGNPNSRSFFEQHTGVKLPKTVAGTEKAIREWAQIPTVNPRPGKLDRSPESLIELANEAVGTDKAKAESVKRITDQLRKDLTEAPPLTESEQAEYDQWVKTIESKSDSVEIGRDKSQMAAERLVDANKKARHYRKEGNEYVVYEDRPKDKQETVDESGSSGSMKPAADDDLESVFDDWVGVQTPTAPATKVAPTKSSTGLTEGFKHMGGAISENLYRGMYDRMKAGKLPAPFPADKQPAFEQLAKKEYDAGRVKDWHDLWQLANPEHSIPEGHATGDGALTTAQIVKANRPVKLLGERALLVQHETHGDLSYELYKTPTVGIIRTFDNKTGRAHELLKYATLAEAADAFTKATERAKSVGELIKTAGSETVKGLEDIGKGLGEIFKFGSKGNTFGSGPAFDEETYERAKPLLIEGVKHFHKAGMSFADALRGLLDWLKETYDLTVEKILEMRPYIMRFMSDWKAGKIKVEEETVDTAAHDAAHSPNNELPEPTQGQKDAGNYQKGHVRVSGLNVSIENPEGSIRRGKDRTGKEWAMTLKSHYGYIRGYEGADGDHVDIFIEPGSPLNYDGPVFVVNQTKGNGHLDEHKVMLGWATEAEAKAGYLENYEKGWDNFRNIAHFDNPQMFRTWLDNGDLKKVADSPYGTLEKPNVPLLATAFAKKFLDGHSYSTIVEPRKEASDLIGAKVEPGSVAAKMVDEAVELGVVKAAREIVKESYAASRVDPSGPLEYFLNPERFIYRDLVGLYNRQPNLSVRTSSSIENQAYSTPVPLAYVASRLAGITPETTVYEPTAGNGMLLIEANPDKVWANELDKQRVDNLDSLGLKTVFREDATEYLPKGGTIGFDTVIANPPFGPKKDVTGPGTVESREYQVTPEYRTKQIDHAIAIKALEAMKDDGSAVLIVGGIKETDPKLRAAGYSESAKRAFYFSLYRDYNVVDHFTVDGDLYKKQGAGWPVDVIVVHGRGKSARTLPAVDVPRVYNSWDELEGVFNEPYRKLLDAQRANQQHAQPQSGQPAASGSDQGLPGADLGSGDLPGSTSGQTGVSNPRGGGPDRGSRGSINPSGPRGDGSDIRPRGNTGERTPADNAEPGSTAAPGPPADTRTPAGDATGERPASSDLVRGDGTQGLGGQSDRGSVESRKIEAVDVTKSQVPYKPASKAAGLNTLIPVNMATSVEQALQNIVDRVGDLDAYVAKELGYPSSDLSKWFTAEQVDGIALVVDNIKRDSGMIVGDQGGIGKGRILAAAGIRYAMRHGLVPIFVTEKAGLYKDIVRDLVAIGEGTHADWVNWALMTNNGESIPLDDDEKHILKSQDSQRHTAKLERLRGKESIAPHKAVFTTYTQIQNLEGQPTERQAFLKLFAQGGVLIFDESHNAGGPGSGARVTKKQRELMRQHGPDYAVSRSAFARKLIALAHGVVYSSATYAKHPGVMDLYSKTNMRYAVDRIEELANAIACGGVPLQQAVAAMLAEDGQMIRRERDMSGLTFETTPIKVDHHVADTVATTMQKVRQFDVAKEMAVDVLKDQLASNGEVTGLNIATGIAGIDSTVFSSMIHNLIADMAMMLKVDGVVEQTIASIKRGEKPVIVVAKTMGAFIEDYAKTHGLRPGDVLDAGFADILHRYVKSTRTIRIKGAFDNVTHHYLTDQQLGPIGLQLFNHVENFIDAQDWSMLPLSPIDYIKHKVAQAGYTLGEITGRSHIVDYKSRKSSKAEETFFQSYNKRPGTELTTKGRNRVIVQFNNKEDMHGIIMNESGSTGISMHASRDVKDQRMRHMIIAQPHLNIDTFMQTLWRVDRTGQVALPTYELLTGDIPSENRPAAVLKRKMASMNANTTAAKEGAYESADMPDFMNKHGDEVAAQVMYDNPELHDLMGTPLRSVAGGLEPEGAIAKVTGRMMLLPLEQQKTVFDELSSEYRDTIKRLDAMGENDLEAKTLDLDARPIARTEVAAARSDIKSRFAEAAYAQEMEIKKLGKPMTSKEVAEQIALTLKVDADTPFEEMQEMGDDQMNDIRRDVENRFNDFLNSTIDNMSDTSKVAAKRTQLLGTYNDWRDDISTLSVGSTVKMDVGRGNNLTQMRGIVTKVEQKGKPKNPTAQGSWRITIAVPDATRHVTIPLSQIHSAEIAAQTSARVDGRFQMVPLLDAFDLGQSEVREQRTIMTGNLLAAFSKFPKGRFINFTDQGGQVHQGVLMPTDFNIQQELDTQPVQFANPEHVWAFLDQGQGTRLVTTADGVMKLTYDKGSLRIASPMSGRQYYLNHAIRNASSQDFTKRGNNMVMTVDRWDAADVIRAIQGERMSLQTDAHKPEARTITGEQAPAAERFPGQAGRVVIGGPPATGYGAGSYGSGPSRDLFHRIRGAVAAVRGVGLEPRKNYSTTGRLQDIWTGNLSQLARANERAFEAALMAAGAKTSGKMLMRRAWEQIQSILRFKGAADMFRAVMVEGRLRGVKDRWSDLASLALDLDEAEFKEFYAGGGDEYETGIRPLMQMLEGMPFGKEYKVTEGFDAKDSLVGMTDSLLATDDINAARAYVSSIFEAAGKSVASVVDDDDFNEFINRPDFQRALDVYKDLLERPMNEAHALNEGVFSDALGPLGTYYPLTALDETGNALHRVRTRVFKGTEYRVPDNPRNKMATGLSPSYDVSPEALGAAVSIAERRNTVANLLRTMEKEGLVRTLKRNEAAPHSISYGPEDYEATTVAKGRDRTLLIDHKTVYISAPRLLIPKWLEKELRPILEEGDYSTGNIVALIGRVNQWGMAGPIDAAMHVANMIGAVVVGTPYAGTDIASKTIGNTPVTKLLTAVINIVTTDPWTDNAVKDIEAMSKMGVIPTRYGTVASGWLARGREFASHTGAEKKYLSLAPLLYGPGGIDIRARLLMFRIAKTAMPNASITEQRKFINMLGNYNFETQGSIERFLKTYSISPFYTAGSTMWRTGIKATFGATPLPSSGETPLRRASLRIQTLLSGGIIGVLGMWVIAYRAYTGHWPWDDERMRLLQIPLNQKDRHRWLAQKVYGKGEQDAYVGFGFFSPLIERGLRSTGITAAVNAWSSGATKGQASEEWEREVFNSAIHPYVSGPAMSGGIVFAKGVHPYQSNTRDVTGRENDLFMPATRVTRPGLSKWTARSVEGVANLNSFYGDIARNIGFVQEPLGMEEDHKTSGANPPNPWLRMALNLVAPRLIKGTPNLAKQRQGFARQAKAIESSVRKAEGLPKKEPERNVGPQPPAAPTPPGAPQ